jgi:hypothetical protein
LTRILIKTRNFFAILSTASLISLGLFFLSFLTAKFRVLYSFSAFFLELGSFCTGTIDCHIERLGEDNIRFRSNENRPVQLKVVTTKALDKPVKKKGKLEFFVRKKDVFKLDNVSYCQPMLLAV